MKPYLSDQEIKSLENLLKKRRGDMWEWGSGGSTIYFSKFCNEYYSIEHKSNWHKAINNIKPKNVKCFLVPNDIPQAEKDDGTKEEFASYIKFINNFKGKIFDYVFIDGRARPYCAEECLNFISKDSYIIIHDWPDKDSEDKTRIPYRSVLDFLNLVKIVDKLAFFKKK
jgi:hypothetical protein